MITGKRVRLRAIERADLPKFHEWLNDADVAAGLSRYLPLSSLEEEKWFEQVIEGEPAQQPMAIEIRDGDHWALAGNTGLFHLEWANRSAELGIFIGDKSKWDRGYGTEALGLVLQHAFHTLNLNRVFLRVFANNDRARRAYEKAGFVIEGTLREALFRHGRYTDVILMSILRSEWETHGEG